MGDKNAGRVAPPKMSMRVVLESSGLGQYFSYFQQAGYAMIDGSSHWSDLDVEDVLNTVEGRSGVQFQRTERVMLWKALRLMWSRGPGHDCPFIQPSEVPPLFLPKRDWRQMDADVKYLKLEPDRQRQILRRKTVCKGGSVTEMQFEVYIRQQDIFYELKDVQMCVSVWLKADPRKMLREDPREEAMKLRIRTMMDAAVGFLQVRKLELASKRRWAIFFLLCRIALCCMSILMFVIGYLRFNGAPSSLQNKFWYASGQFRSGTSFMLAYWVAYLVADRTKEDRQNRRFHRIIIALERLMEEISSFRVETDPLRMEEHEAVQRNEDAMMTYEMGRSKKAETGQGETKRRRRKKAVDKEMAAWAPGVKMNNMEEFNLKTQKAIEESFKRLPPLPDNFRRNGGDRMLQFEDKGLLGGVEEHVRHVKAPWQIIRGEARPDSIEIIPPTLRAKPLPRRPALPPPRGGMSHTVPHLEDLRQASMGETPPSDAGAGGWDEPGDPLSLGGEVPPTQSLREAMRSASDSLPGSRARTHSLGMGSPRGGDGPPPPPVFPPRSTAADEFMPEVPPLEPLLDPAAAAAAFEPPPQPRAQRGGRRGSKDVPEEGVAAEAQAAASVAFDPAERSPAESSGLRYAGAAEDSPPLPPRPGAPESP